MRVCKNVRAFTLVELITVISVIGILTAILAPFVGKAIDKAHKLRASKNLQQIAMAYASFSLKSSSKELNLCKTANEWAGVMAKHDILNSASIFILGDDYLSEQNTHDTPKTIGSKKDGIWHMNEGFKDYPLSVVVITGVSSHAPADTTPIAYTRGLDNGSGVWRKSDGNSGGVYGEDGGFIVFLDGHVEFFENLVDPENKLVNFYTGERTSKISEAVNHGARALSWLGIEWTAE